MQSEFEKIIAKNQIKLKILLTVEVTYNFDSRKNQRVQMIESTTKYIGAGFVVHVMLRIYDQPDLQLFKPPIIHVHEILNRVVK